MRCLWWIIGCLLIAISPLWAGSAMLNWDNPTLNSDGTPLTDPGSIHVHQGTSSGQYGTTINVGWVTSASLSGLTEGQTYFWVVTALDVSGNESGPSNEVSKTIPADPPPPPPPPGDTIPPTVSITSPANGATVPRKGTVTIAAQASDNSGVVARVEMYVNGSLLCADGTVPFACTWSVPPAGGNRHYQLQAKAFDPTGNNASSAVVDVVAR